MIVAFVSYGNDSIALLQWLHEKGEKDVCALHSDTGWAAPWWAERVEEAEAWVESLGYWHDRTTSEGMFSLALWKKAWPSQQFQFCTTHLKINPARAWLAENDPTGEAILCNGVRREESQRRATRPEWLKSESYPGYEEWSPLVRTREKERNAILSRTPFPPLPTRSSECWPCVNANKPDVAELTEGRIVQIERMEAAMGVGEESGKPKTIFRPHKHGHAVGIRAVWVWACSKSGRYDPDTALMFGLGSGAGCDSGMCSG